MAQIALAEEPFQIAFRRNAEMLAAQGRPLVSVALGIRHVALLAVIAVENGACRDSVGPVGHRIGTNVVSGRDPIPRGVRYGTGEGARSDGQDQNRNC
jgi:hypothetical protein